MKLLYLADIRFPMERANGIQTIQTCHALARQGVHVELVVRRSDSRSDEECLSFFDLVPHPNLHLRRVRTIGRVGFLLNSLSLLARNWDYVYTRDLLLADLCIKVSSAPVVFEAHTVASSFAAESENLYSRGKPASASKLKRLDARECRVFNNASGIVTITKALFEELQNSYGIAKKHIVAPDGCHISEQSPSPIQGNKVYYIGQLYPWKGVDVLIQAMQYVKDAELIVVGGFVEEPDLTRLQNLAKTLELGNRIHFKGFVPPSDLDIERQHAAVFVVPNIDSTVGRFHTSPLKLFEAMAARRPLVASNLPAIREVLTHERNALLVPPSNPRALATALCSLMSDRQLSERLAATAFEDVQKYSWDKRADKICSLLD